MGDADSTFRPGDGRNHRKPCQGKSVVRWEFDYEDEYGKHKKGDPKLDEDYRRQYRPCNAWGANGTDYCHVHGGSAPQVIAAAKRKLALSAEEMSETLVQIATDERIQPETRVKAAAQVLDRIGIRLGVDVSLEVPRWQKLIGKMFGSEVEGDLPPQEPASVPASVPASRKASKPTAKPKDKTRPKFEGWA